VNKKIEKTLVLHYVGSNSTYAVFVGEPQTRSLDEQRTYVLTRRQREWMGNPKRIKLTIEAA
jgi:hypothetical protein